METIKKLRITFHKITNFIALCIFFNTLSAQTCDVDLIGFDPETNQISVAILDGENCGCNEFTQQDGNTCEESTSTHLNNNESISHFVFGIHYYENYSENDCSQADFHPGWAFAYPPGQSTLNASSGYTSGDTLNIELNTFFSWDCILDTPIEGECWELVVWQINLSQTASPDDFPNDFWTDTCGTCANQTQMYPDIDLSNNSLVWCPDELPPPPLYPGCTDSEADNYDPSSTWDDGSCEYTILGCTSPTACNYNQLANENDGTCVFCNTPNGEELCNAYHGSDDYWDWYVSIFDCVEGCTDPNADNYNQDADIDDGSCIFLSPDATPHVGFTGTSCQNGIPSNQYNITVKNSCESSFPFGNATDTLFVYCVEIPEIGFDECQDGYESGQYWIEPCGGQFVSSVSIPETITEFTVNVYYAEDENSEYSYNNSITIQNIISGPDPCEVLGCTDPLASNYDQWANVDDGSCEYDIDASVDSLIINEGCEGSTPYWQPTILLSNLTNPAITEYCIKLQVLGQTNDTICFSTGGNIIPSFGQIELEWPNPIYSYGVVSIHLLDVNGESQDSWNDFGEDANIENNMLVVIVGGPTVECDILGCIDPEALNYNEEATVDDGSCEYLELTFIDIDAEFGCDSIEGGYYVPVIVLENTGNTDIVNFCLSYDIYGSLYDEEVCWEGLLLPGELVYIEFPEAYADGLGAAYIQANGINSSISWTEVVTNINFAAEADDQCVYGCMDPNANNYNPDAEVDNYSCAYDILGCTDPEANNYNELANVDDGSCTYDILGCTDPEANNYNELANVDDGSCTYDILGCTDPTAMNYNVMATEDDGSCEYAFYLAGCTDPTAMNYNVMATEDDGSCIYDSCDGSYFAPNTFTPNNDGINDGWSVVTDPDCWLEWEVMIFNRWGGLVWISNIPGEVWIGGVNGGNHYVADGVYVYSIRAVGVNPSNTFQKSGHISVFR